MQSSPPSAITDADAASAVETIEDAQSIIVKAAETRDVDPDTVIEAIRWVGFFFFHQGGRVRSRKPQQGGEGGGGV